MTHIDGLLFFFSSRRRHTRYWRDWSSDVCSSDLDVNWTIVGAADINLDGHIDLVWQHQTRGLLAVWFMNGTNIIGSAVMESVSDPRSEERRVGKECRSRWSPYH